MEISQEDLKQAVGQQVLSQQQADKLWEFLASRPSSAEPRFSFAAVVYYLGALIVLAAMMWLAKLGEEVIGRFGLFYISLAYAYLFAHLGAYLWHRTHYRIGGGLLCTLAVCMVPLAIYGLEQGLGMWPAFSFSDFDESAYQTYEIVSHRYWLSLEIGTILAALIALYFVRFPFLMAPLTLALWFLTLDSLTVWEGKGELSNEAYEQTSLLFGLGMLVLAYFLDRRTKQDFAFWSYLFGLTAFSIGLTGLMMVGSSEGAKLGFAGINLILLFLAVALNRQVFLVFGAAGIFMYLCYLAYEVFQDSLLFPLILSVLGLLIIYLGVLYQRHQHKIQQAVLKVIPKSLQKVLPPTNTNKSS